MAVYLSMQRVRFSSPDAYDKFLVVFGDVRNHLKDLPGFMHLTWWQHPDDPTWFNEVSMWASKEALVDWHMNTYHKHAKEWAAGGAIMEDIITNFELASTRLLRVCPTCGKFQDLPFDLTRSSRCWPSRARSAASTSPSCPRPPTVPRCSRTSCSVAAQRSPRPPACPTRSRVRFKPPARGTATTPAGSSSSSVQDNAPGSGATGTTR